MKAEALCKENQSLKAQVETLKDEFDKTKLTIQQMEPPYLRENIEVSLTAAAESSLEFLSKEYDDFGEFRRHAQQEIQRLHNCLLEIRSKVETVRKAIEELEDYSYQFNIKIIEHIASPESAKDTSTPPIADRNPTEN